MSSTKSKGLGKGLEALFGDVEIQSDAGITMVDIHKIRPNNLQPREAFDEEGISELAASIEAHGIIQPIILRKTEGGFEIVAGERRWRAAHKAGLKEVPVIIRELSDQQNAFMVLIENMQREDLNSIEEARGLERLVKDFNLTQENISKSVGKSRPYVANALRLLKLPGEIQEMIGDGSLSGGHGRALAGLKDVSAQLILAHEAVENNWTVRDIEKRIKNFEAKPLKKEKKKAVANPEVATVEEELKNIMGAKVKIRGSSNKGRIEIEYYSRSELDRLIEVLRRQ